MNRSSAMSGLISLAVLVVASILILWGMNRVSESAAGTAVKDELSRDLGEIISAKDYKKIDTEDNRIERAYVCLDGNANAVGYAVYVSQKGYNGDILSCVVFETDKKTVRGLRVIEQNETENLGARVAHQDFTAQFEGISTPVGAGKTSYRDGSYKAYDDGFENGYRNFVEMKIADGKIVSVNWDAESQNGGKSKKQASKDGEYVMTEDGPLWHQQAENVEKKLIETQKLTSITYDENGKTDAVTGVSISVDSFARLASKCLDEAGASSGGIDTVTGATISSNAVINAVNLAGEFLNE